MDILCHRCGEPWDTDTFHDVADELGITSEQDRGPGDRAWNGRRLYTVREALPDGHIEGVSEFGQFASWAGARSFIKRLAQKASA